MSARPNARYDRYLESPAWRAAREAAIRRARGLCQWCGAAGKLEVHHLSYARLGHERPGDLAALCRDCHRMATAGITWKRRAGTPARLADPAALDFDIGPHIGGAEAEYAEDALAEFLGDDWRER